MTGFEYTYTSIEDIFTNITTLADFSIVEYVLLGVLLLGLFSFVYIVLPSLFITYTYQAQQRDKKKRKKLLTQISLQKEIEEEIEKEIQIQDEAKLAEAL